MATLNENLKDYFETKKEVVAAYLFGSYARGKEQPSSDIDVGVLLYRNDDGFCRKMREELLLDLSREVTEKMVKAVGFRNLIVHEYAKIDFKLVYDIAGKDVEDLQAFLKSVFVKLGITP